MADLDRFAWQGPNELKTEIYDRLLDCEICGMEINPDREEYYRGMRVCRRCLNEIQREEKRDGS